MVKFEFLNPDEAINKTVKKLFLNELLIDYVVEVCELC